MSLLPTRTDKKEAGLLYGMQLSATWQYTEK